MDRPGREREPGQRLDGLPSFPPRPRPLLQVVRKGRAKEQAEQEGREPGRGMPPTSSPVPRLPSCSVCCRHRPHHRPPLTLTTSHQQPGREEGRPPRPLLGDAIATHCHHLATTSPPIDQQTAAGQRLDGLPSFPPRPLPLLQVVRAGQRASQGGRSSPAHPVDSLHPAGVPRHICRHLRRCGGGRVDISGRRGCSARKFVSGIFARLYRSKYQLFNFSEGLSRAMPVHRGNGNCT